MEIKKVEYMVCLKNDFFMPKTTIRRQFCGKLENIADGRFYFRLNGSNAVVIVPHREIELVSLCVPLFFSEFRRSRLYS